MRYYERSHLYRSSQVAGILGISKKTLNRMIADGRIPVPVRDGSNNWRIWTHQEVLELKEGLLKEKVAR
jgi:excisionase family DNA binding protein